MEATIDTIWKEYHTILLQFIQRRVTDKPTAEDILQDVFIKILNNIRDLKDKSKIKSWLYQITRNTIIDHYRSKKQYREIPGSLSEKEEKENLITAEDEIGFVLLPIINTLPEKYREALMLSEIQGISQKELAERLNISYTNAKSRVQRGRKMLKKSLTDCCTFNVDAYGKILDYKEIKGSCDTPC